MLSYSKDFQTRLHCEIYINKYIKLYIAPIYSYSTIYPKYVYLLINLKIESVPFRKINLRYPQGNWHSLILLKAGWTYFPVTRVIRSRETYLSHWMIDAWGQCHRSFVRFYIGADCLQNCSYNFEDILLYRFICFSLW